MGVFSRPWNTLCFKPLFQACFKPPVSRPVSSPCENTSVQTPFPGPCFKPCFTPCFTPCQMIIELIYFIDIIWLCCVILVSWKNQLIAGRGVFHTRYRISWIGKGQQHPRGPPLPTFRSYWRSWLAEIALNDLEKTNKAVLESVCWN